MSIKMNQNPEVQNGTLKFYLHLQLFWSRYMCKPGLRKPQNQAEKSRTTVQI